MNYIILFIYQVSQGFNVILNLDVTIQSANGSFLRHKPLLTMPHFCQG